MTKVPPAPYILFLVIFGAVVFFNFGVLLITILFLCLALKKLPRVGPPWVSVPLFSIMVILALFDITCAIRESVFTIPQILSKSLPLVIQSAKDHGFDLPFTDLDGLKTLTLGKIKENLASIGAMTKIAAKEFAMVIVGTVMAVSIYLNSREREPKNLSKSLYSVVSSDLTDLFRSFFESFRTVVGAQLTISLINTFFTAVFLLCVSMPYAWVAIGITFFCGLLPIIGNLISNSVIVCIAITVSPKLAVAALMFLIVLHKLEYFLNSKIIGVRIKTPVWLTLLGLIVGERLMGISGIILSPVVIHFVKKELSNISASLANRSQGS